MKPVVYGSLEPSAGKTSLIIGLGRVLKRSFAYLKPFGDRLLYRKKRQWDYDSALLTSVFHLEETPEVITLGFDHSKLRFMYDADGVRQKLIAMADSVRQQRDFFFIEGGRDLAFGASVYLDPLTIAASLDAQLVLVLNGQPGTVEDQVAFIRHYVNVNKVRFAGVIVNKVRDPDDFRAEHLSVLTGSGIPVLGVVPFCEMLTRYPVAFVAEQLFAKVLAGGSGLRRVVSNVLVVAMGLNASRRFAEFRAEDTLVITGGDRTDIILAAIENGVAGIVLTGDLVPEASLITRAEDRGIPLLLVRFHTAQTVRLLDHLDPLITKDDQAMLDMTEVLVRDHVKLDFLND